jgi:hypothetical protein
MLPILDLWAEFSGGEMARHTSHDYLAIAPWRAEVEGKRIVFDELILSV